ncbi:MAG: helical backbone metal receptor [Phycisphaerales bacterium]|nr:helical backbone metal receptor [Phycisphaerales bacterium]
MNRASQNRIAASLVVVLIAVLWVRCDSKHAESAPSPATLPKRIVTIAPNAAEIIAALGEADRLVGVSRYCKYPPELSLKERVGGLIDPDLEKILRLKPDLVVIRGRIPEVERLCEANQIRLYRDPTQAFDDIFIAISQLGAILEKKTSAKKLIRDMRTQIDKIADAVSERPRPRVLFTTERNPDSLSRVITMGKNTFVDVIISRAGGENIFGDRKVLYPEVSLESILAAQPDVIIEVLPEIKDITETRRGKIIEQWRNLGNMPAAKNNRIHIITDNDLIIPSPRIVESIARMARLLHPEVQID